MRTGQDPQMASPLDGPARPAGSAQQQAVRRAEVVLRSMGQPNSVVGQFGFRDDSYEGRRLFSEVLATFFLVLVAVLGGTQAALGTPGTRWRPGRIGNPEPVPAAPPRLPDGSSGSPQAPAAGG